jgi:hypothetical protein
MPQKPILVPARLRRPPPTDWSWVDRRFIREHMAYLSRESVLLYFFLSAVADKHGLSFYADGTLACSAFFGPPDKGDFLLHTYVSLRASHCSVMSSPLVAGCAELFGRRVID